MQFEDPRTTLEAAAAKPSRGLDAAALVKQGARLRRARLAAVVTGVTVVLVAASASFGRLTGNGRDAAPGPAAPTEGACPSSNRVSLYLRDGMPADEGRALARLLEKQARELNAASRIEYVSKRQASGDSARLDLADVDPASVARLEAMLAARLAEVEAKARHTACAEEIEESPAPEPTAVVHAEPPAPVGGERAAVVEVLRAECRTRSVDRSISFRDATRWCRFVLLVDNQGSRSLTLKADDQVLRAANGEASPPAEDVMSGDFSTRLFTSPIPAGRRRMGQVIFLVLPDDIPAALELHPRPGFAPGSVLLEYDCARDLHDEPGGRCFLGPRAARISLEQTWARMSVTLYHCGFEPVSFRGREWVVPDPPFDATNAPESFSAHGLFKQRSSRDALYYDDGGEVVHFEAIEDWEPPPCA